MVVNKKTISFLTLSLLLGSSLAQSADTNNTPKTVALASAIAYTCQPDTSETAEELLKQAALIEEKNYALQNRFTFPNAESCPQYASEMADEVERMGTKEAAGDWDAFIKSFPEDNLFKYVDISGIVDGTFHTACTELIESAHNLASKFPKAILQEEDQEIKACLEEALEDLETLEFGLLFLDKLFTQHKHFFEIAELSNELASTYGEEFITLTCQLDFSAEKDQQLAADLKKLQTLLADKKSGRYPLLNAMQEEVLDDLLALQDFCKN